MSNPNNNPYNYPYNYPPAPYPPVAHPHYPPHYPPQYPPSHVHYPPHYAYQYGQNPYQPHPGYPPQMAHHASHAPMPAYPAQAQVQPQVPKKPKSKSPLDTQEEIKKWVESRKRNYPSKKNIEKKEKMIKAKAEKGIPVTLGSLKNMENISLLEKKLRNEHVRPTKPEGHMNKRKRKRPHNKDRSTKIVKFEEGDQTTPLKEGTQALEMQKEKLVTEEGTKEMKKHENSRAQSQKKQQNKANAKLPFKYKKNTIYSDLIKKEKEAEATVLLQCFRYIIKQNLL
ncbi:unnamed protein product [Moneuplotes crassus]|uniref:FMR1-interacting protein 1 conserved domain-containing protein n=1 Tax=Euplotes crassus TaxID=5936 RepID=A0AAD1UHR5_EUPCR|nr:unnamed protein product [Moneuplotes crassus]